MLSVNLKHHSCSDGLATLDTVLPGCSTVPPTLAAGVLHCMPVPCTSCWNEAAGTFVSQASTHPRSCFKHLIDSWRKGHCYLYIEDWCRKDLRILSRMTMHRLEWSYVIQHAVHTDGCWTHETWWKIMIMIMIITRNVGQCPTWWPPCRI